MKGESRSQQRLRLRFLFGRAEKFEAVSDEEARQRCAARTVSAAETEAHVALWRAIREWRLARVTDTFAQVLGDKLPGMDQRTIENAQAFR